MIAEAKTPMTDTTSDPRAKNPRAGERHHHRPSPGPRDDGRIRPRRRERRLLLLLRKKMRHAGPEEARASSSSSSSPNPDRRPAVVIRRATPPLRLRLLLSLVVVVVIVSSISVVVPTFGAEVLPGGDDGCPSSYEVDGGEDVERDDVMVAGGPSRDEESSSRRHHPAADHGPNKWRWEPDAPHRCDVRRIQHGDLATVFASSGGLVPKLYHEPVVIDYRNGNDEQHDDGGAVDDHYNGEFARMTSIENITSQFDVGFEVTLSSSNSFSQHRRVVTLERYIRETTSTETLPSHMSNESWYLFGETYTDPWVRLLTSYRLPPCQTCTRDLSALAFGIGNRGSGVQWHVHGPGFSESIHGRKHWVLYPPSDRPDYDANFTSRHWMEMVYPDLPIRRLPRECTLHPGEVIYFPDGWYHATVNLDDYTAFVSTFTTEHL